MAQDNINGVANTDYNWIGKDHWMNIKQGAGLGLGVASVSVERSAQSPSAGGLSLIIH